MTRQSADALVVMPAYNEGIRIGTVLQRLRASVPDADVVVVDDGSQDDTAARARAAGVHVISHPFNLGYGAALQTGYKYAASAGHSYVVQLDADGQHDPADVTRLLAPLRAGAADVVIGSRFVENTGYDMGVTRGVGRRVFQLVLRACGGPFIADPTSGYQAFTRDAFTLLCEDFYPSDFPDVDVLLLLHRNGLRLREEPVVMAANPEAHTSMHAGWRAVYYTYKMLLATFRAAMTPIIRRAPAMRQSRSVAPSTSAPAADARLARAKQGE
jgi:glycosyltransferase involved in cell wall biosynthesis